LPSKYIFHASSPVYEGNANPEASMALVVKNCLQKATTINCHSISMPLLVKFFDYPKEDATDYMIKAVLDWCENNHNTQPLDIRFVNFEDNIVNEFVERLDRNLNVDNNSVS
jgi:O-acetyl-ADP-ribose deacetylase (regulator of RNase III)